jgi:hypothetical protein
MDNAQNYDSYINIPSSQTYISHEHSNTAMIVLKLSRVSSDLSSGTNKTVNFRLAIPP